MKKRIFSKNIFLGKILFGKLENPVEWNPRIQVSANLMVRTSPVAYNVGVNQYLASLLSSHPRLVSVSVN